MESNGVAKRKGLPHEIEIDKNETEQNAKTGKRPRDDKDDGDMTLSSPQSLSKKPYHGGTPTSSGALSFSHSSVAGRSSIVKGEAKRPPPPPSEPPPRPRDIVKILCLGPSDTASRKQCIVDLTRRLSSTVAASAANSIQSAAAAATPVKTSITSAGGGDSDGKESRGPCSLEYFKKDYTFQSATGQERAVRMQFLHLDGRPTDTPPELWQEARKKIHLAVLIVDMSEMMAWWKDGDLESRLESWRSVVNTWTHPLLPLNLLLMGVSDAPRPAATLLRLGAAIAQTCRRHKVNRWFLLGSESAHGSAGAVGLDSTDAVLQSLVQEALSLPSSSSSGLEETESGKGLNVISTANQTANSSALKPGTITCPDTSSAVNNDASKEETADPKPLASTPTKPASNGSKPTKESKTSPKRTPTEKRNTRKKTK